MGLISFLFVICEPGHFCTKQFEQIEDELSQCEWYALPIKFQRKYMVSLADTQTPTRLHSYGGVVCNRETSKKVFTQIQHHFIMPIEIQHFPFSPFAFPDTQQGFLIFHDISQI